VRQYGPHLRQFGIEIYEHVLAWGSSLPAKRAWAPAWMAATLAQRAVQQWASYSCDVTLIQRQLLPAFIPTHRFTKAPRVLDVDDAIWLNRWANTLPNWRIRVNGSSVAIAFLRISLVSGMTT
jgi:hypothetical protein